MFLIQFNKKKHFKEETHVWNIEQKNIFHVLNICSTKSTGVHFNSPGHTLSNMTVTILETIIGDAFYRNLLLGKFNTYHRGLNQQPLKKAIIHL